jgi:hypothetical protein
VTVRRARRKFLGYFPDGFRDETYLDWERDYKWQAARRWQEELSKASMRALLDRGDHAEVAQRAVRIESRTNLLFSFEKMALRDALKEPAGAKGFAEGLYDWLHGTGSERGRFERWLDAVEELPRRQTRVLTWPVVTVFGFLARPKVHFFLKPTVTRCALEEVGIDFEYVSRPNAGTYLELLDAAKQVKAELADLRPRDMIDIQSFLWVQGSDEYP